MGVVGRTDMILQTTVKTLLVREDWRDVLKEVVGYFPYIPDKTY